MKISCNRLKKYIDNADNIDWLKLWDLFTIRTAEVEEVVRRGKDIRDVVIAEIVEHKHHPTKDNYSLVKVSDGVNTYSVLCGAPNVRLGLKVAYVKPGGMVGGVTIGEKEIAGFLSSGMLCSGAELDINSNGDGIIELPSDAPLGMDLKNYLPIEDIIVEIDNKSLTNRPDLWGHYGIAREVCAITGHKLKSLEILEVENNKTDLEISIKEQDLCKRYVGIKVGNIKNINTPLEDQIFLHYAGMRSKSLLIDVTNILMLELGQPMHAFDSRVVKNIEVGLAKDGDKYITLDGNERLLTKETLMIKNGDEYFGIAGIMGGKDSEVEDDTTSVVIESANFDATCIRKSATRLGLRSEASARYEKTLDPEMCILATKRILHLIKQQNPDMEILSNLTDIKCYESEEKVITLRNKTVKTYLDEDISEERIISILESLEFKVEKVDDNYIVTVPSFRATKDITIEADLIEEVSRMYGYENITPKPLCTPLTFKEHEFTYTNIYNIKKFLADRYSLHEVHSYIWYDSSFLKQNNIHKENITVVNKQDNNILRDDMSLSLMPIVKENLKNINKVNIFEVGTIIKDGKNKTMLSVILAGSINDLESNYQTAKNIINELFKNQKNKVASLRSYEPVSYYANEYAKEILVEDKVLGTLNVSKVSIGKKKIAVCIDIDIDILLAMPKEEMTAKEISKYPTVSLDYTIICNRNMKYETLDKVLNSYNNEYIIDCKLVDVYHDNDKTKYTIRYTVGSMEKTLEQVELNMFKERFIKHIKQNNLEIVE